MTMSIPFDDYISARIFIFDHGGTPSLREFGEGWTYYAEHVICPSWSFVTATPWGRIESELCYDSYHEACQACAKAISMYLVHDIDTCNILMAEHLLTLHHQKQVTFWLKNKTVTVLDSFSDDDNNPF